ncbi:MAG: hypothetical protein AAF961_08690 [Planctomycetota bacterium]
MDACVYSQRESTDPYRREIMSHQPLDYAALNRRLEWLAVKRRRRAIGLSFLAIAVLAGVAAIFVAVLASSTASQIVDGLLAVAFGSLVFSVLFLISSAGRDGRSGPDFSNPGRFFPPH